VIDCIEIEDRKEWDVDVVLGDSKTPSLTMKIQKGLSEVLLPRFSNQNAKDHQAIQQEDSKLIINEDIQVTEWAPDVFAFLRQKDGYSNQILLESLNPLNNKDSVFKAGESQGKSGSFFFFSSD